MLLMLINTMFQINEMAADLLNHTDRNGLKATLTILRS